MTAYAATTAITAYAATYAATTVPLLLPMLSLPMLLPLLLALLLLYLSTCRSYLSCSVALILAASTEWHNNDGVSFCCETLSIVCSSPLKYLMPDWTLVRNEMAFSPGSSMNVITVPVISDRNAIWQVNRTRSTTSVSIAVSTFSHNFLYAAKSYRARARARGGGLTRSYNAL